MYLSFSYWVSLRGGGYRHIINKTAIIMFVFHILPLQILVRERGWGVDKTVPLLSIRCAKCNYWTVITELFEAMPCITRQFVLAGKYRSKPLKE